MSRNYGDIKREKYWDLQYPDKVSQVNHILSNAYRYSLQRKPERKKK